MTRDDIILIEDKTGVTLPAHYIDVVTSYPAELAQTEAPDFGLLDDPSEIIEENLYVRKHGYCGGPWPSQYFIIGKNGCGDYYVIRHESTSFSVGFADHEIAQCNAFAGSLEDFIRKLLEEQGDLS